MNIKLEIIQMCGEKVGSLFANTQGKVGPLEFRTKFSFKEIVELERTVNNSRYESLIEYCAENQIVMGMNFLTSLRKLIIAYCIKCADYVFFEESFGSWGFKGALSLKAEKVFEYKRKPFLEETVKQVQEDIKLGQFFRSSILENQSAKNFEKDQLKEKVVALAKEGISNSLNRKYLFFRDMDLSDFETFFSEDLENLSNSVLLDLQQNGFLP